MSKTTEPKLVYFAGKVSKGGGYRGKLFNESRVMSLGYRIYGGPFALANDHGTFHGAGQHGLTIPKDKSEFIYANCDHYPDVFGYDESWGKSHDFYLGISRGEAASRCLTQISSCDAVHAYLDTISCYGTLSELGYASALAKPIYIYYKDGAQNWQKHFWFIFNLPNVACCEPGTETSIHPDLLVPAKSYKERYHDYLKSPEWKAKREQKLFEAGGKCQLCNEGGKLHVHHRTYERVFNELMSDLIVLCQSCHEKFHDIAAAS